VTILVLRGNLNHIILKVNCASQLYNALYHLYLVDDWDNPTSLDTIYLYFPRPPRYLAYLRSYSVSYLKFPAFRRALELDNMGFR
jgi:hypothetical protein